MENMRISICCFVFYFVLINTLNFFVILFYGVDEKMFKDYYFLFNKINSIIYLLRKL